VSATLFFCLFWIFAKLGIVADHILKITVMHQNFNLHSILCYLTAMDIAKLSLYLKEENPIKQPYRGIIPV